MKKINNKTAFLRMNGIRKEDRNKREIKGKNRKKSKNKMHFCVRNEYGKKLKTNVKLEKLRKNQKTKCTFAYEMNRKKSSKQA